MRSPSKFGFGFPAPQLRPWFTPGFRVRALPLKFWVCFFSSCASGAPQAPCHSSSGVGNVWGPSPATPPARGHARLLLMAIRATYAVLSRPGEGVAAGTLQVALSRRPPEGRTRQGLVLGRSQLATVPHRRAAVSPALGRWHPGRQARVSLRAAAAKPALPRRARSRLYLHLRARPHLCTPLLLVKGEGAQPSGGMWVRAVHPPGGWQRPHLFPSLPRLRGRICPQDAGFLVHKSYSFPALEP